VVRKSERKENEDNIETEAADEIHRKPRCFCGEEVGREEMRKNKKDFLFYSRNLFRTLPFSHVLLHIN
jgi:hypothetical protein